MTDNAQPAVRVRFAPSPTGMLHVGSARAALFNWLYARHAGGTFLLRIEDTDLERSTEEATNQILRSLEWLGLTADEPVEYQAQRAGLHRDYVTRLLDAGHAYRCYCPKDRLDALREESRTRGTIFAYRREMLPADEAARLEAAGAPFVIRFRAPLGGTTEFEDLVYGRISVENDNIGDFVIARGDGSPLYNFTNVVDDIEMRITLVCRGEDHVSNTPKQVMIYRALGVELPRFAHLPLILGPDKQKLSKRHGATGVLQFAEMGILPEALINFLALLGWAPGEAEFNEVMPVSEIISRFSLDRVNKSPAVFDHEKLLWMNGMHIRQLPADEVVRRVKPVLEARLPEAAGADPARLATLVALVTERSRTLNEFADNLEYFFRAPATYDDKAMRKFLFTREQVNLLRETGRIVAESWDAAAAAASGDTAAWGHAMEEPLRKWGDGAGIKFGNIAQPVRLAVTGRTASPPLFDVLWLLGRDEVVRRIEACAAAAAKSR